MIFNNRTEAGQELARHLRKYANREDVLVIGTPRGGVPVAFEIAKALDLPLDILVLRKLGVPGQEELAFGAIASGEIRVLDRDTIEALRLDDQEIERVTRAEKRELNRRDRAYRGNRPALNVQRRTVIVVDDGIATGSSMRAAVRALKQMGAATIVIATPVAPPSTCRELAAEVDDLVCLYAPEQFYGVGQFYVDFAPVSDAEVIETLNSAWRNEGDRSREEVTRTRPHAK